MGDSAVVDEQPIDIHQYSRALRAAAPRIAIFSLIAAAAAIVFSVIHQSSSTYAASTSILAGDTLSTAPALDSTTAARRLATVNLLTRTTKVLSYAANRLDGVTVDQLRTVVGSSIDPNANVITITASGPTQAAATARADGVANALITIERQIEQQASTDARRSALAELARLREEGADALTIRAVESQLALQAAGALGSVGGFQVLQAAEPLQSSAAPVWLSSGIVVFFAVALLGMLVVLAREQVSPRLSATDDLGRFFEIPVLWSIPSTRVLTDRRDLARLPPAVRDAFYVLASATRREAPVHGKILLVTSALRGMETTAVAANLGRALSTTDARVLVVSADLGSPRLHEWLDAPRAPGLADVLDALSLQANDGRGIESVPTDAFHGAIHHSSSATYPTLDVMPMGRAEGDHRGMMFGDALPRFFMRLRLLPYDIVIVDGPPAVESAEFPQLATHADAILAVVRADRLRMSQSLEFREALDAFASKWRGLVVIDRRPHPTTRGTPEQLEDTGVTEAVGGRGIVEVP